MGPLYKLVANLYTVINPPLRIDTSGLPCNLEILCLSLSLSFVFYVALFFQTPLFLSSSDDELLDEGVSLVAAAGEEEGPTGI